jgi:hypothetical protein
MSRLKWGLLFFVGGLAVHLLIPSTNPPAFGLVMMDLSGVVFCFFGIYLFVTALGGATR